MIPQQLTLLTVEQQAPIPILKGIIWTKTFQGWRGEFAAIGSRQRKKYTEYDYECQIYDPTGRYETYIQVSSANNTAIEHDFCATVTRLVDERTSKVLASPDCNESGDFIKEVFRDTRQAENPDCYVLEQVKNETVPDVPELSAAGENEFCIKGELNNTKQAGNPDCYVLEQVKNETFSVVPELGTVGDNDLCIKGELNNTKQAENPDFYVLEQVKNATVPELSTEKCLQWIEIYSPSKRKSKYFRYCWKDTRMHHMHISGGSVTNEIALLRRGEIENAIAHSKSPMQI